MKVLVYIWSLVLCLWTSGVQASEVCRQAREQSQSQQRNLTSAVRAAIVCDLKKAFQQKYSLLVLKKDRLGLDVAAHLDSCAGREMAEADTRLYTFEDRLLQCLAVLRDSHVSLIAQTPRPILVSGLSFREVGGQIVLAGWDQKLLKLNRDPALIGQLRVGLIAQSIDGQPPEAWLTRLSTYINASSPALRRHQAVRALSIRDFSYPSSSDLRIRFAGQTQDVRVKWFIHPMAMRSDVRDLLFGELQLNSTVALGLDRRRPADGFSDGYAGYDERNTLASTVEQTYLTEAGSLAIQTGFLELPRGPVCYLRIADSVARRLKAVDRPNEIADRRLEINRFIRICRGSSMDMVLDLRRNSGGDFRVPLEDVAALLPKGLTIGSGFTTGRLTQQLRRALDVYFLGPQFPLKEWKDFSNDRFYRAVLQAEREGTIHISAVPYRNLQASAGGYEGAMAVLISPLCFSGCEVMAAALRNRPRTQLIGLPTTGSGGMRFETKVDLIEAQFRDDIFSTIQVQIPNALFGVLPAPISGGELIPFATVERHILENTPLLPDVRHELSIDDLVNGNQDLKKVIANSLKKPAP